MSITERREREKQEMRQAILNAAKELFVERGYEKVNIRNIADKIEYSPGKIYLHFKDKDEILFEVHEMAFQQLFDVFQQVAQEGGPVEKVRNIGKAYLDFALANPDLYDLMFILHEPMNCAEPNGGWDCGFQTYFFFRNLVEDAVSQNLLKAPFGVDTLTISLWATMHGVASLHIRNRFKMLTPEQISAIMDNCLDNMMAAFKTT